MEDHNKISAEDLEWAKKMERKARLREQIYDLFADVESTDAAVRQYFDLESDKMLSKKVKVLTAIKNGKSKEEIGKDYYDVLELLDVPDGMATVLYGEVLDPHEFD